MSKITFDKETIELLNENPYVVKVSEKSITYSDEFKRLFIEEYLKGKHLKLFLMTLVLIHKSLDKEDTNKRQLDG